MPKARKPKRKTPVTAPVPAQSAHPRSASSRPQATRTTIRRFHVLLKRQNQLQHIIQVGQKDAASARSELRVIEQQIEDLGGLAAYQRMSTIGQGKDRGGGSERVLVEWMRELGLHEAPKLKDNRLRLALASIVSYRSVPLKFQ